MTTPDVTGKPSAPAASTPASGSAALLEQIKRWRKAEKHWAAAIIGQLHIGYEDDLRSKMERELQALRIVADRECR